MGRISERVANRPHLGGPRKQKAIGTADHQTRWAEQQRLKAEYRRQNVERMRLIREQKGTES